MGVIKLSLKGIFGLIRFILLAMAMCSFVYVLEILYEFKTREKKITCPNITHNIYGIKETLTVMLIIMVAAIANQPDQIRMPELSQFICSSTGCPTVNGQNKNSVLMTTNVKSPCIEVLD